MALNVVPRKGDLQIVQDICHLITKRSARLVSVSIASLALKIGKKSITVAVDGSLFENYPGYRQTMIDTLKDLCSVEIDLDLVQDGSNIGAALAASLE